MAKYVREQKYMQVGMKNRKSPNRGLINILYILSLLIQWTYKSWNRHETIVLQTFSNMVLNSAPMITSDILEKMAIIPKIMPLILANNESLYH